MVNNEFCLIFREESLENPRVKTCLQESKFDALTHSFGTAITTTPTPYLKQQKVNYSSFRTFLLFFKYCYHVVITAMEKFVICCTEDAYHAELFSFTETREDAPPPPPQKKKKKKKKRKKSKEGDQLLLSIP